MVNTHWHWDHSFGNAAFREEDPRVPIHAHEDAAAMLAEKGDHMKGRFAESDDPHRDDVAETELVLPDHTFSSTRALDLGDRTVELVFPGRGHTDGDLVVRVPDVDVVLGGDLIEESAKPWIGLDSFAAGVAGVARRGGRAGHRQTRIVPGHGVPVDRAFVETSATSWPSSRDGAPAGRQRRTGGRGRRGGRVALGVRRPHRQRGAPGLRGTAARRPWLPVV